MAEQTSRRELGHHFAELAERLRRGDDAVCQAVVDWCVRLVPGCDHASVMLGREQGYRTVAASDDVALGIDTFEREVGDGPCVDAMVEEACQLERDLSVAPTWPSLAARVLAETPVRSMLAYRLIRDGEKNGAINLFADRPDCFDAASVDQAAVLASFTSVALDAARDRERATNLEQALDSNREIGKAIGLLMATHNLTDEQAFGVLRQASQSLNRKLRDIAVEMISKSRPVPEATRSAAG